MTTKELLDEYAGCYRVVDSCRQEEKYGKPCLTCLADINRMQEIEKELEASIRKDTIAEMRALDVATLPERGVLEQKIRREVVMKLETYFGHVLNDGTGKPMKIELDQLAYEVIKIINGIDIK